MELLDKQKYDQAQTELIKKLATHKAKKSISYEVFAQQLAMNANQLLVKRGLLHGFAIDASNKNIIEQLYYYIIGSDKCKWNLHAGIILAGPVGCGKTLLMDSFIAVSNNLCIKQIKRYHANELVEYMAEKGFKDIEALPLFIDELGREPTQVKDYGTSRFPVQELIARRYEIGARTYATTNYTMSKLTECYKPYIATRIQEMCNFVIMSGENRRKNNQF